MSFLLQKLSNGNDKKFAFETHANDLFKFIWNHKLPHAKNINAPTL